MTPDLFNLLLSMDAYNRGYAEGMTGLGGVGSQIGDATVVQQSDTARLSAPRAGSASVKQTGRSRPTRLISLRFRDRRSGRRQARGGHAGFLAVASNPVPETRPSHGAPNAELAREFCP